MIIIKKYPIVVQEEIKDCGVSCIQMILNYYKGNVNKNTLLEMTKTNKQGTTAYNLKETLNKLGFKAKGVRCNLEDINKNNVILPCIASVIINKSYKHFIVIYEINFKKKYLIIGDPATKVKKISYKEFNKIFNNVLIITYPIQNIPNDPKIDLKNFIIKLIQPHKKILKNILLLSLFITVFSIITSFYTEYMLNSINYYSIRNLIYTFIIFFSVYVLKIISNYFRNQLLIYINLKLDLVLTLDTFNKIIELPYNYYQNKTTGDLISRINDLESIRDVISRVALSIFVDLPLTCISLIILFLINKTLFIIGLIILLLYLLVVIIFNEPLNNTIKKIQENKGKSVSYMVESITGYETINGMNIKDDIKNNFEKKYVKYLKNINKYQSIYFLEALFKEIINDIGFIVITLVGCILVIKNKMNIGSLFTFTSLLIYFLDPIKNIINLNSTIIEAKNSLKRILNVITYQKRNKNLETKFKNGDIVFKKLNFSFDDRKYTLKNISFKIKRNSKCMVIGKSGSGKSTAFKILMKYYNVKNNQVYINNIDINNIKNISDNILYLGQNEVLFNDTLYNNLIFDNSKEKELNKIANACYLNEILDKNLGYNMLIEENGFNLSGGEKQRLFLARALLKNFDILIIDEGLSQVDVDMERKILKNIFNIFKNKTIIVISHRLDNLDLFDQLIKLEKGVVYTSEKIR